MTARITALACRLLPYASFAPLGALLMALLLQLVGSAK